jgi:DNA-binding CsgD family transcriptional regulator
MKKATTSYEKSIKSAIERGIAYGKARGLSNEQSEDLAQRWVIKVFVEQTGQRLEQAYVDFLRFEFGDTRAASGLAKSKARRTYTDVSDRTNGREFTYSVDSGSCYDTRNYKLKLISYKESAILGLISQGLKMKQIGNKLGVTESRVSQICKEIKEKVQIADLSKNIIVNWITL